MFDQLTEDARKAISLAHEEARTCHHAHVGTEHLLLGLIHEHGGMASHVLVSMGASSAMIREQLRPVVNLGRATRPLADLPFTPIVVKALMCAMEEAAILRHDRVNTGHLLLGLIKAGDDVTARALVTSGVRVHDIRARLLALLEAAPTSAYGERRASTGWQFTECAKSALNFAHKQARALNHAYLGTEHVLLGLAEERAGIAARLLDRKHLHAGRVVEEVTKIVKAGRAITPTEPILFTPGTKSALELAMNAADRLGHGRVGTGHLLLGFGSCQRV